ncbi:MAG TPA: NAD-dependent epimerase/dehydratase family protein [Clostridia bacterium]|nr:NAD-dependent epimerase/dehydratase family protein [Clostridia bacterium]
MTTYIVTGAYGHLGSTIITELIRQNKKVRGLILFGEKPTIEQSVFTGAEIFEGDVTDINSLENLFDVEGEKIVIHTAGIVSIENKINKKMYEVNVTGTSNVIAMCNKHNARLLHVSSVHAIPDRPKGTKIVEIDHFDPKKVKGGYAKTKAIATNLVLQAAKNGLNASVVMPSGIIGPFDNGRNHLVALIKDFLAGKLRAVVKGGYDVVDVRDVASACITAADTAKIGETYILSNAYIGIKELCDQISQISNVKPIRNVIPIWFAYMFSPLSEAYYKIRGVRPLYTAYSLTVVMSNGVLDHSKATKELDFHPRDLNESISDTVKWLKSSCVFNAPKYVLKATKKTIKN